MGHVVDKWTDPGPSGRRVRNDRWGRGKRYLARWTERGGKVKALAFETKAAAQAHLAQVDVDIRGGTYVGRSDLTFEEYAKRWLPRQEQHRANTSSQAESRLRLHAYPRIGHMRLDQVTRGDVQDVISQAELAPSSKEVLYAFVSAVFSSAVEDRLIAFTPCRKISLPKIPKRMVMPLSVDEVEALADGVPKHLRGMVWLGAGSGLRPGELRALTTDRLVDGVLLVDRQMTDETRAQKVVWGPLKNDASPRHVPLSAVTRERLAEHLERFPPNGHGLLFSSVRRAPLRRSQLDYAWKASGARGKGWHELRHHHASLLIAAGVSPRAVADRLGHADPSETLRTYSHLWPTDEGRILDAIEEAHRRPGEGFSDAG